MTSNAYKALDETHCFRVSVSALIFDGERVLLAHRRAIDWWNLPGGAVDPGETVDEALRREVQLWREEPIRRVAARCALQRPLRTRQLGAWRATAAKTCNAPKTFTRIAAAGSATVSGTNVIAAR